MKSSNFNIVKILKYLPNKRRRQLVFTFIVMVLSGFTELLVINSVMPFLAVIINPASLSNYKLSIIISKLFGISLDGEVIFPFIILFAIFILLSACLRLLSLWLSFNVTALLGNDLSTKSFSKNIYQPYIFHLYNASSKAITSNTFFINNTVNSFSSFLNLIYSLLLAIIISAAIFFINPFLTFYTLIIFSTIYLLIEKNFKKLISNNSRLRTLAEQSLIKSLQESLGSIRNVLLESNQELYINNFKNYDIRSRKIRAKNNLITEFPRYAIEAFALIFIAITSLFLMGDLSNSSSKLITLGAFILGVQKLLPAFQRIYQSWVIIKSHKSDLENTIAILELKVPMPSSINITPLKFKNSIKFDSVYFKYQKDEYIISDLNFEIYKGQRIGIIGETGSGKTTISDLLMGLLKPSMGNIYVDGKNIHDNKHPNYIKKWMSSISHVPQNIFLTDATIKENIAFGIKKNLISFKRVKECAKKAQIHDFIDSTIDGYFTKVGERGVRLSGGQLQRIAIARALYKKSEILVFDEATSALDNKTESDLMKSISNLSNEMTLITIAHRHSTLKNYDRIFKVEKGFMKEVDKENLEV